ncbi:MAG: DUF669 domain-containing protein [Gemmataceae bacterium]
MADLHGFNANEVDPSSGFDPIPAGKYLAMITDSEMKPTKSGDGAYLQLTFQVLDGEFKNRFVWARLNLHNKNETAMKIARAQLSALCRAAGVMTPKDSCELHNLPVVITVKCKKDKDTGDVQNEIRGFAKKEAGGGQPQQATAGAPPWKR